MHRILRGILLDLAERPGVLYCIIAGVLTLWGKYMWAATEALNLRSGELAGLPLSDLMFLAGLTIVIIVAENFWSPAKYITALICFIVALVALFNAAWLRGTGDQLGRSVLEMIWESPVDSIKVALDEAKAVHLISFAIGFAVPVVLPLVISRFGAGAKQRERRIKWLALSVPLTVLLIALLGKLLIQSSDVQIVRAVSKNAHISLVSGVFKSTIETKKKRKAIVEVPKVFLDRIDENASHRNVIIIALESGSYAHSSFGDPKADRTPFLAELAKKGLTATNMRAVLPHTTKSLFSIWCGAYPNMERKMLENADNYPSNCLPRVLGGLGYSSAFFQSANGEFEGRARLANNLGFREFYDRIALGIEETVHLSGDDMGLVEPVVDWIKGQEQPFVLGILTSLTHTPYGIPYRMSHKKCKLDWTTCRRWRYEVLYPEGDRMVKSIIEKLEGTGILDETIIVVTGDHGESLGEHRKWTHDNVYYDEGLKVPYVVWAPGLLDKQTVDEPRSLIDTYPTILSMLGVPYDKRSMPGISLTEKQQKDTKRYFTCFYDGYCYGYVQNNHKVVYLPKEETSISLDLEGDPKENDPTTNNPLLAEDLEALHDWMESRKKIIAKPKYANARLFKAWECKKNRSGNCKYSPQSEEKQTKKDKDKDKDNKEHGLNASYFTKRNFQGKKITRFDKNVDFHWGLSRRPFRGMPNGNYSVFWEGCLLVKEGESPFLAIGSPDGTLLYVDNNLFIDNGGAHHYEMKTATEPIKPGIHQIRLEYTELHFAARAFLGWSPGGSGEISRPIAIPSDRLIPTGGNSQYTCPASPLQPKFGLSATYFSKRNFEGESHQRIDGTIDFNWGKGAPMKEIPKDGFSVRWEGCLVVKDNEKPQIVMGSDDSIRVYVNDKLVIKNKGKHKYKVRKAKKRLKPGVYNLRVEYEDIYKDSQVWMKWAPWGCNVSWYVSKGRLVPLGGNSQYSCPVK